MTRRALLALSAGGLLPGLRGAESRAGLIINSAWPKDYEMKLEGFQDWITPVENFFVRCHHYVPEVDLQAWRLDIGGRVDRPGVLSFEQLKGMPRTTVIGVLECAGNGRAFYEPHMAGMQWRYGGVGNGRWTGVRLRDVLAKTGVLDGAKHILFDGADVPPGTMPDFQRTIPIEKAMHEDTLLAFEMNGKALTADHGFPLRLIVPGWAGDSWVKWVTGIKALDQDFDGFWMKTAYRHPAKPVAPGTAVPPAEMVPVSDLPLKSVIASPTTDWIRPQPVRISGAAWANGVEITGVEVSTDGGSTWRSATLGKDRSRYAWRLWQLDWTPAEGKYELLARATDAAGNRQPLEPQWNPSGYLWNVARRQVVVSKDSAPQAAGPPPPVDAPAGYRTACHGCHGDDMVQMQKLTPSQWDRELKKMEGWGAQIKAEERDTLLKYLSDRYKP